MAPVRSPPTAKGLRLVRGWRREIPRTPSGSATFPSSHNRIGDVLVAQGDGPGALASYRKGLAIREGLAALDPTNVQWQIDVAVSCAKFGTQTGLTQPERRSYLQRGLQIQQALSASDRLAPNSELDRLV